MLKNVLLIKKCVHYQTHFLLKAVQISVHLFNLTGPAGIWTFGLGFIAAALSSMLTIPLGASLTAESVFNIRKSDTSSVVKYKENEVTTEAKKDKVRLKNRTVVKY